MVGGHHVVTGAAAVGFATDWTGRFRGYTPAVVRPRDTAEVARVLALCADAGIAVVPQGGNTGLVVFAGLTMFDFQRLRRSKDMDSAPLLAASIFLDALNVFLFFLRIFGRNN